MKCVHCSEEIEDGKKFCGGCGEKVLEMECKKDNFCAECGTKLEDGKDFCGECGWKKGTASIVKPDSGMTNQGKEFRFKGFLRRKNPAGKGAVDTTVQVNQNGLFLRKSICRNRRLPRKITEKEVDFKEIQSVNVEFTTSFGYLFMLFAMVALLCLCGQIYTIIFVFFGMNECRGETITLNLKYEDPYYISSRGKKSEEFVKMVVNELRKNG